MLSFGSTCCTSSKLPVFQPKDNGFFKAVTFQSSSRNFETALLVRFTSLASRTHGNPKISHGVRKGLPRLCSLVSGYLLRDQQRPSPITFARQESKSGSSLLSERSSIMSLRSLTIGVLLHQKTGSCHLLFITSRLGTSSVHSSRNRNLRGDENDRSYLENLWHTGFLTTPF